MAINKINLIQLALKLRSFNSDVYFSIKTFANHFMFKGIFARNLFDQIKGTILASLIRINTKLYSKVKVQEVKPIVVVPKYRVFRGFKPNLNYSQRLNPNRHSIESFKSNSVLGKVFGHYAPNSLVNSAIRNANFQNTVGITLGLVGIRFYQRDQEIILYDEKDELDFFCTSMSELFKQIQVVPETSHEAEINDLSINQLDFGKYISKGSCAVVYEANLKSNISQPLAIKMMFNYAESNSADILRLMGNEYLTFHGKFGENVDRILKTNQRKITPHPNIIKILGFFTDLVPYLEDAIKLYPAALPSCFCEEGFGRNMTLFLAMKLYHTNLKKYLTSHKPSLSTSLILLYQLFDGVDHLVKNKVAHRDLKTNNILLDLSHGDEYPWLVITDFGFASTSLKMRFVSEETVRGGNLALMAPEIITPPGNVLDYTSADLWSCGAIGYEIMNELNPFYLYEGQHKVLFSYDYNESDLPDIKSCTSISNLLKVILSRDPKSRPSAQLAACITFLLRYSRFNLELVPNLAKDKLLIKSEKLHSWLKEICSMLLFSDHLKPSNEVELQICISFFSKLDPDILFKAIHFLKSN